MNKPASNPTRFADLVTTEPTTSPTSRANHDFADLAASKPRLR
jgi:hypothetical protein